MLYPSVASLVKVAGNRYSLVSVVSKRARQIADEMIADKSVSTQKPVTLAIGDLSQGRIIVKGVKEII